jgi:serine/threonine protein kinase
MSSKFNPRPNETICLKRETYIVQPHPIAIGVAFSAAGRRGTVYAMAKSGNRTSYALKVFKAKYRNSSLTEAARRLKRFENLEGMLAASRSTIEPTDSVTKTYPELLYAMLMPWVEGSTWFDVLSASRDSGPVFDAVTAFALCKQFLLVMSGLEQVGVAHTDISPGNVAVDPQATDVQLLDLEDLYVPGSPLPNDQNKGSIGYNHPSADQGRSTWCREGDRYAAAILAS